MKTISLVLVTVAIVLIGCASHPTAQVEKGPKDVKHPEVSIRGDTRGPGNYVHTDLNPHMMLHTLLIASGTEVPDGGEDYVITVVHDEALGVNPPSYTATYRGVMSGRENHFLLIGDQVIVKKTESVAVR